MHRPTLGLQTLCFGESDQAEARRLGVDVYELVTRPVADPLGFGAGFPCCQVSRPKRWTSRRPMLWC
jgi:hypothetical protein